MSTPTGKPFTPVRISDYAPKRVRDNAAAEDDPKQDGAAERPTRPPKKSRERPAETQPREGDERHEAPLAPTGPHEQSEPGQVDIDRIAQRYGVQAAPADEAADGGSAGSAYDEDLERLKDTLQSMRRERDAHEERIDALPWARRASTERRSGRTYIDDIPLPRSLEPAFLPAPPLREHANHLGALMRVLIACAIAGPIAYGMVYYLTPASAPSQPARGAKLAAVETQAAALRPLPVSQLTEVREVPHGSAPEMPLVPVRQVTTWPDEPARLDPAPQQDGTIGLARPAESPAPAKAPVHAIDPDEITLLLKQGEQFVAAGDLVTARVVFRRAAEAGDAGGALALGATYDPVVLAKMGVRGIAPDIEQARSWYEKARDFGSAEAPHLLQALADR